MRLKNLKPIAIGTDFYATYPCLSTHSCKSIQENQEQRI